MDAEIACDAYDDFMMVIMPQTRRAIRELVTDTDPLCHARARMSYLESCMTEKITEVLQLMARYQAYVRQNSVLERLLTGKDIQDGVKDICTLQGQIIGLRRTLEGKETDRITDEMIERAKNYPIADLIEVRNRQARCPFHEDKTASMHQYGNRLHCFSCNKSWDTIGLVMDRDGLPFRAAIRRLTA